MTKRFAVTVGAAVFLLLVLCTAAAYRIEVLLLSEVHTEQGFLTEKTKEGVVCTKIPTACVCYDSTGSAYVNGIWRREGVWGEETYVRRKKITVLACDSSFCSVEGEDLQGVTLAIYPSRPLSEDETVRCIE